jgi:hypothetical protein
VIERAAERFFAEMEKPADQPAAHGFERMMRLALDRSEQRMPLFLRLTVQMSLELGASHPELRARLQRIRERARDLMEQSLAKPLADLGPQGPELARELSSLALALAEGTCIANEIDPAAVDLERAPADLRAAITAIASLRLDENPR